MLATILLLGGLSTKETLCTVQGGVPLSVFVICSWEIWCGDIGDPDSGTQAMCLEVYCRFSALSATVLTSLAVSCASTVHRCRVSGPTLADQSLSTLPSLTNRTDSRTSPTSRKTIRETSRGTSRRTSRSRSPPARRRVSVGTRRRRWCLCLSDRRRRRPSTDTRRRSSRRPSAA